MFYVLSNFLFQEIGRQTEALKLLVLTRNRVLSAGVENTTLQSNSLARASNAAFSCSLWRVTTKLSCTAGVSLFILPACFYDMADLGNGFLKILAGLIDGECFLRRAVKRARQQIQTAVHQRFSLALVGFECVQVGADVGPDASVVGVPNHVIDFRHDERIAPHRKVQGHEVALEIVDQRVCTG